LRGRVAGYRAAALKKAAPILPAGPAVSLQEPFILHNVDVLSTIDLRRMLCFHGRDGAPWQPSRLSAADNFATPALRTNNTAFAAARERKPMERTASLCALAGDQQAQPLAFFRPYVLTSNASPR